MIKQINLLIKTHIIPITLCKFASKFNKRFDMMKKVLVSFLMACSLTATAQEIADPNIGRAEKMFGFLLQDQVDSLYENLAAQVKPMIQKQQLAGGLKQVEPVVGKYQSHSPWEVQEMMGQKCYVSTVQFEKAELGAVVVFDAQGKMLGIQVVPASAIKKE